MIRRIVFALSLGLGLALGLLWLLGSQNSVALADPGILYVAPGGDCGGATPCYATVQAAVDAASTGDEIRVAAGAYTGVHTRTAPAGYDGSAVITQVVYISKSLIIRGGYTAAFADPPDPEANQTSLDAQRRGRVMFITGDINPTIEGLRITGGDATGLGGGLGWNDDAGGGVYVHIAAAVISGNLVYSNTAYRGAGLWLEDSTAALTANAIVSNTADWAGGGLWLNNSAATLSDNSVISNTAPYGGGVILYYSDATLSGNTVTSNAASGEGGGLSLLNSAATLSGNTVAANSVNHEGGGLFLYDSDATLINNVVADNQANTLGSGLYIKRSAPHLLHTTIARNTGDEGSGVYITGYQSGETYYPSTVAMTNTIIVGHAVGIVVTVGDTATLNATLLHGNTTNWDGAGTINHTNDRSGAPAFAADGYHLTSGSAAIDAGVGTGVTTDIDGDARPQGAGYDIGADEFRQRYVYLPLVMKNHTQ